MSDVIAFPTKGRPARQVVITINGYWSGPLYHFEVTAPGKPADVDPRITTTATFDAAVHAALEYIEAIGIKSTFGPNDVQFVLTAESTLGGAA